MKVFTTGTLSQNSQFLKNDSANFGRNLILLFLLCLFSLTGSYGQGAKVDKLEQSANGASGSETSPTSWVTGIVNRSKAHFAEGMNIPYRLTLSNLKQDVVYTVTIGYDTQKDFLHAIDFLTSYDYVGTHGTFGHEPENIDPTSGTGLDSSIFDEAPIPPPGIIEGSIPESEFIKIHDFHKNILAGDDKQIRIYNGEIVEPLAYGVQESFTLGTSKSELVVKFKVNTGQSKVVIAWGGHIAAAWLGSGEFWGDGNSASAINGAPYHMFISSCDSSILNGCGNKEVQLHADAVSPPPSCSLTGPSNVCAGGNNVTYTATVINPEGETYAWTLTNSGGANASISSSPPYTSSIEVDPGTEGGSYSVQLIVTNENGLTSEPCLTSTTVGQITAFSDPTNVTCNGGTDGEVEITFSGGSSPYSINFDGTDYPNQTSPATFSNLAADSYSWTITDSQGCTATGSEIISEPSQVSLTTSSTNVTCNGIGDGKLSIVSSSGDGDAVFSLKVGDGEFQVTTEDAIETATYGPGTYEIQVAYPDGNGNVGVCKTSSTEIISQPNQVSLSTSSTNVTCNGVGDGKLSIVSSSGDGDPVFSLKVGDGEFQVTTEDAIETASYGPGTYEIQVAYPDGNGNVGVCKTSSTEIISQPDLLQATVTPSHESCITNDGSATVSPSGGTGEYTYLWNDPNKQTTATATNLAAGSYSVKVTDANGCETTVSTTINGPANCAHIFPTGTTCEIYDKDPEGNVLNELCLTVADGKITNVTPGAFFYWGDFVATSRNSDILIDQQKPGSINMFFDPQNSSNVRIYDESCRDIKGLKVSILSDGDVRIQFKTSIGAKYIVSVKYDPKSIIGGEVSETNNFYSFGMYNGVAAIGGSFGTINAVNCDVSSGNLMLFSISVESENVGVENTNDIAVYPVPFSEYINIGYNLNYVSDVQIDIFDFGNNLLKSVSAPQVTSGSVTEIPVDFYINVDQIYIVRVTTDRETFVKQIVAKP